MNQQQMLAYLHWCEQRGLRHPLSRQKQNHVNAPIPQAELPQETPNVGPKYVESTLVMLIGGATHAEIDMLKRIADALQVPTDRTAIIEISSLSEQQLLELIHSSRGLLLAGHEAAQALKEHDLADMVGPMNEVFVAPSGPTTLLIPHPRAMIAQPQLKISAWEGLKHFASCLLDKS